MNEEIEKKIEEHFLNLKGELETAYSDNSNFKDEKECSDWYKGMFALCDAETEDVKKRFLTKVDENIIKAYSEIPKDFLKEKLLNEKEYDSESFKEFVLEEYLK